ncbi:MAG: glycosyltransferase family 39 protein, partial [Myxococcota bacterium]|nr:glycosyltransferase family 39 protein [Myxococcota bacterium]
MLGVLVMALLLPRLGEPGLWDPHEISRVEAAHEVASSPTLTVPERHARPPVPLLLLALGLRALGTSEVAVRLPVALCALLTLAALYFLARRCGTPRAGVLAVLVLLTVPTFFLGARQATSHL